MLKVQCFYKSVPAYFLGVDKKRKGYLVELRNRTVIVPLLQDLDFKDHLKQGVLDF